MKPKYLAIVAALAVSSASASGERIEMTYPDCNYQTCQSNFSYRGESYTVDCSTIFNDELRNKSCNIMPRLEGLIVKAISPEENSSKIGPMTISPDPRDIATLVPQNYHTKK